MKPVNLQGRCITFILHINSKDNHFCALIAAYMNLLLCPSPKHTPTCSQTQCLKQLRVQCFISRLYQTKLTERRHYINTGPVEWRLKDPRTRYTRTQFSEAALNYDRNTTIGNLCQCYNPKLILLSCMVTAICTPEPLFIADNMDCVLDFGLILHQLGTVLKVCTLPAYTKVQQNFSY